MTITLICSLPKAKLQDRVRIAYLKERIAGMTLLSCAPDPNARFTPHRISYVGHKILEGLTALEARQKRITKEQFLKIASKLCFAVVDADWLIQTWFERQFDYLVQEQADAKCSIDDAKACLKKAQERLKELI